MTFNTYYWANYPLKSSELERDRGLLARSGDAALPAFERLLRSDDSAAVCVALDHYEHAEASTRHGVTSGFAPYSDEVKRLALDILRQAPIAAASNVEEGANHASALGALLNLAEARDADLIATALERAHTSNVRFAAANAAGTALQSSKAPSGRLLMALENVLLDASAGRDERSAALQAIASAQSPAATGALLGATRTPDLGLQARAAMRLIDRDLPAHRAYLEALVRGWPPDAPYPADEVRDRLGIPPPR